MVLESAAMTVGHAIFFFILERFVSRRGVLCVFRLLVTFQPIFSKDYIDSLGPPPLRV
jgi:hypothetical protein